MTAELTAELEDLGTQRLEAEREVENAKHAISTKRWARQAFSTIHIFSDTCTSTSGVSNAVISCN